MFVNFLFQKKKMDHFQNEVLLFEPKKEMKTNIPRVSYKVKRGIKVLMEDTTVFSFFFFYWQSFSSMVVRYRSSKELWTEL